MSETIRRAVAWVFPGQGSQVVGMGRALVERYPEAARTFAEADAALGYDLSQVCFDGPADLLTRTDNAQPAILTTSVAQLRALLAHMPTAIGVDDAAGAQLAYLLDPDAIVGMGMIMGGPLAAAGHSLGEYTAFVAAGALTFADAVRLVRERGRLMNEASVGEGGSGMVAVLGFDDDKIEQACQETGAQVANYNAPGQTVVSGTTAEIARFTATVKEMGARKVMALPVSAAFHSKLMRPTANQLSAYMDKTGIHFAHAHIPVISNVDARPQTFANEIRAELIMQTYSPVQWVKSVQRMADGGATTFVEIGPGKVLSGMIKRIVKDATLVASDDLLVAE